MSRPAKHQRRRTATHRPATRRRRFQHDDLTAGELFSGFGGLTAGIKRAGFTAIVAANHNPYKVEVHEANFPEAEHWIADLVDRESADYHDVRQLPAVDLLAAGVSCKNHSHANTLKAYEQGLTLFDLEDPDYEAQVTRSERDRATANCVLHYAQVHHPRLILVECTTELTSWGPALPGRPKVGDGSTYRWWLKQFENLNYRYRVLYLNSMFFDVPQSRNRLFIAMWDKSLPTPDLDHRPHSWCDRCDQVVEGVWTWRTGVPPTGSVRYGEQYDYRCPSCRGPVIPPIAPSLSALDLTHLGTRIGDRPLKKFTNKKTGEVMWLPLAPATMARAERCRQRFQDFPAVFVPAKASPGSTREAVMLAVDNFQGGPRSAAEPLPTQVGSETLALVSAGILPFRKHTIPTVHAEAMPTFTSDQIPGLLTAAGTIKNNGGIDEARYRAHPVSDPLGTVVATSASQALLFSGWQEQNTTMGTAAQWRAALADLALEDCNFRMMRAHEIGRACGFDVDFPDHTGEFVVWGTPSEQVDGFGNAVSPAIGTWIGDRLRAILHPLEALV